MLFVVWYGKMSLLKPIQVVIRIENLKNLGMVIIMERIEVYEINTSLTKITIDETQENNVKILFDRFAGSSRYSHLRISYHLEKTKRIDGILLYDYHQKQNKYDFSLEQFAYKLFEAEKIKSGARSQTIKSGTLFIKQTGSELLLMKLEQTETVDRTTYEIKGDFGTDENYYKLCVFNNDLENIIVVDKSKKVTKYWVDKFLSLSLVKDSDKNTSDLIKLIDDK